MSSNTIANKIANIKENNNKVIIKDIHPIFMTPNEYINHNKPFPQQRAPRPKAPAYYTTK